MHRHPTSTVATLLVLLTTSLATTPLEPRQSQNLWHISSSYIGCGAYTCGYQFHISGTDTGELPYFEADCVLNNIPTGDTVFHQCNLVGAGSRTGVLVNEVDAAVTLYPGGEYQSKLVVQLKIQRPGRGPTEYWQAEQVGQYTTFSQHLSDYDVVPMQAAAVA